MHTIHLTRPHRVVLNSRQHAVLWIGITIALLLALFTLPQHAAGFDPLAGGYDHPHHIPYYTPLFVRLGTVAVLTVGILAILADRRRARP
jgi:hypothetical protein